MPNVRPIRPAPTIERLEERIDGLDRLVEERVRNVEEKIDALERKIDQGHVRLTTSLAESATSLSDFRKDVGRWFFWAVTSAVTGIMALAGTLLLQNL